MFAQLWSLLPRFGIYTLKNLFIRLSRPVGGYPGDGPYIPYGGRREIAATGKIA